MKAIGYESYTSWLVTISCAIIFCLSATPYRIAGLLFVLITENYDTNRETASIPILLFLLIRCLGGPVISVVGEKFGLEVVTIIGCVLTAVGFGTCFYAQSIIGMSLLLGLVFGVGMAFSTALAPNIIKKHFTRNFTTANGIAHAGFCVGALLIPPAATYLIDLYGVSGAFLILSGIMLNSIPVGIYVYQAGAMQNALILHQTNKNKLLYHEEESNKEANHQNNTYESLPLDKTSDSIQYDEDTEPYLQKAYQEVSLVPPQNCELNKKYLRNTEILAIEVKPTIEDNVNPKLQPLNKKESLSLVEVTEKKDTLNDTSCCLSNLPQQSSPKNTSHFSPSLPLQSNSKDTSYFLPSLSRQPNSEETSHFLPSSSQYSNSKDTLQFLPSLSQQSNSKEKRKKNMYGFSVFKDVSFLIIMLNIGLATYVTTLFWTTMIDYSRDKGISRDLEIYFLMLQPLLDLVGRACFGWVTDLGYLTISNYAMLCYGQMALSMFFIMWTSRFGVMMAGACWYGLASGAITTVYPSMIFNCIDKDHQTMAIASRYLLYGALVFTSSPLIGFFRENLGSYDGLYCLFIILCIVCAAVIPLMSKFTKHGKTTKPIGS